MERRERLSGIWMPKKRDHKVVERCLVVFLEQLWPEPGLVWKKRSADLRRYAIPHYSKTISSKKPRKKRGGKLGRGGLERFSKSEEPAQSEYFITDASTNSWG